MRRARLSLALLAMLAASAPAARNFQPPILWSASGGEVTDSQSFLAPSHIASTGGGGALWVAGLELNSNLAVRIMLRPGQEPSFDQFGDNTAENAVEVQRILAADDATALLDLREAGATGLRRDTLAAIDLVDGGIRWAVPLAALRAELLADGEVLVQTTDHLLRLSARGEPRWVRAIADALGAGENASPGALRVAGGTVLVELARTSFQTGADLPRRLQAFALNDGSPAWQQDAATLETRACGLGAAGGAFVVVQRAEFDAQGSTTVTVDRRAPADGTLLARTVLANVPGDDTGCQLVDLDTFTLLSTVDDVGGATLSTIAADGTLRWRVDSTSIFGRSIARIPGTSDVAIAAGIPVSGGIRVERVRGSDGGGAWAADLSQLSGFRAIAATPAGIQLAANRGESVDVVDLAAADGSILATRNVEPRRRRLLPYAAGFIDAAAFDAAVSADGSVRVRRRAIGGGLQWTRDEAGFPAAPIQPVSVQLRGVGATSLLVAARYQYPVASETRNALVVVLLDRASGTLQWRRELGDQANVAPAVVDAGDGGVLVRTYPCPVIGSCLSAPTVLERWSVVDAATLWSRALEPSAAVLAGADALVYAIDAPNTLSWRRLDGSNGGDVWVQPVASPGVLFDLELPSTGGYIVSLGRTLGGVPAVDLERRSLVDGTVQWSLRAGGAGDRVSAPVVRRAVNGFPLLTGRLSRTEPGQEGLVRPLLQLIDDANGTPLLAVQPIVQGDRWWTLRPVAGSGASIVRQPLRSLRYLESLEQPYNSRVALATLDLGTGVPGGEHLVERRFDDPLFGQTGVDLFQVLADGSLLAADQRLGSDGLRRRTLLRLGAPADAGGDLVVRLVDGAPPASGLGPSRTVVVEVENAGTAPASQAVFGTSMRRDRTPAFAVLARCEVVAGTASCPTDPAQRALSLGPGAVLRLHWEVFDPAYVARPPQGEPGIAGLRFFVDAPWDYADDEPGNNVVEVGFRLTSFADDFE